MVRTLLTYSSFKKKSPKKFLGHNFWLKTQAWVRVKIQKYLPTHARTHTCKYTRRYAWTRERDGGRVEL